MSTLNELMVAVADSIRAKEGSTEKIAPVDFPQRINDLQVGGGESGGGSGLKYYRYAGHIGLLPLVGTFLLKYDIEGMIVIVPAATLVFELGRDMELDKVKAFAFDPLAKMSGMNNNPSSIITVGKFWEDSLPPGAELEEITEAEFYDLSV